MAKDNKKELSQATEAEFISRVRTALFESDNSCYMKTVDSIMDQTGETAAEIAAALIGMVLKTPKKPTKSPKKPVQAEKAKPVRVKAKAPAKAKNVCLSITGGLNKNFTHKDILGSLSANTGLKSADIKDVKIGQKQTLLKVSPENASKVLASMKESQAKIKGVPVKVSIYREKKPSTNKPNKKNNLGKK